MKPRKKIRRARNSQLEALSQPEVWLVRHAKPDPLRGNCLSDDGKDDALRTAHWLTRQRRFVMPSLVITSDPLWLPSPTSKACAAKETADAIASVLTEDQPAHCGQPVYTSRAFQEASEFPERFTQAGAIEKILGQAIIDACEVNFTKPHYLNTVVFVGHEPLMRTIKSAIGLHGTVPHAYAMAYQAGMLEQTI